MFPGCHIQYSSPIYESKFGFTTTDFRPKQHTAIKDANIHFWILKPPWLIVNDQWSILFSIKWICTTNILSPQFTAMQHHKWAWTACHPTQRPVKPPSTVPTLPTSVSVSSGFPLPVDSSSGMVEGLSWSRCRVEKRKVDWATGPQVGEKVNIHPMLEDGGEGWWRFLRLRYYSILFPCKNRFVIAFLGM